MCAGGVVVLLPFALWELAQSGTPTVGAQAWGLMAVAALLPGVVAYWVYGWTQKVLGASRVAMALYLGPLYGGIAAWVMLGETPGWHHLGGALLILGLCAWAARRLDRPGSGLPFAAWTVLALLLAPRTGRVVS
jgi:drug/metabolite transporter (DMT)-like permease